MATPNPSAETSAVWQTLKGVEPGAQIGFTTYRGVKWNPGYVGFGPTVKGHAVDEWKTIQSIDLHGGIRTITFVDGTKYSAGTANKFMVRAGRQSNGDKEA